MQVPGDHPRLSQTAWWTADLLALLDTLIASENETALLIVEEPT